MALLGEVAQRTEWIEVRCGRCDRVGRLLTARLLTEYGPNAAMGHVMQAQIGGARTATVRSQNRCDPYCPDFVRLSCKPKPDG